MKIIETPWEKRNLGVTSVNFIIEKTDTLDNLGERILNNKDYQYQTVKLPVNMMDIHDKLNKSGFKFIEGKFELTCNLRKMSFPEELVPIVDRLKYHQITRNEELELLYNKIKDGLFDTDKIAVDPKFGKEMSGIRYYNWTKDEIDSKKSIPYIAYYNEEPVGFFVIKKINDKIAYSLLGAIFNKEAYGGYGIALVYYGAIEAKKMGMQKIITEISTNNISSLRIHIPIGYNIKSMYYVMSKHI